MAENQSNDDGDLGTLDDAFRFLSDRLRDGGPEVEYGAIYAYIDGYLNENERKAVQDCIQRWRRWYEAYWEVRGLSDLSKMPESHEETKKVLVHETSELSFPSDYGECRDGTTIAGYDDVSESRHMASRVKRGWVLAGALALSTLLLIGIWIWLVLPDSDEVALLDKDKPVDVDAEGNLVAPDTFPAAYTEIVAEMLTSRRVAAPVAKGTRGRILGGAPDAYPQLISPVSTAVRSDRPIFRWRSIENAGPYTVSIFLCEGKEAGETVEASNELTAVTEWQSKALDRGRMYAWEVSTVIDGELCFLRARGAPRARFYVLSESELERVAKMEQAAGSSRLALAHVFVQEYMFESALAELDELVRENPKSELARDLRRSVVAMHRGTK